jgi:acetolactate synthase-1/2/3 large subunit
MAMNRCDCLIALGCRFNDRSTGDRTTFAPSGKVVHIDIDSSEFSKTLDDRVEVQGDIRATVEALLGRVESREREQWASEVEELREEERCFADPREGELTPKTVMEAINAAREPQMPVVTDVGQHQMWAAQYLRFDRPRSFITSGGLGTMGFGLGASIGAALSCGEHVILVTGDGSFAMNMAELVTAADHEIPVTIVLLNNGVLGMVRQMQSLFMGQRYSQTTLDRKVDYVAVAKAMGADGERVATLPELEGALARALATPGPVLVECPIDADEFVTPVLQIGASMDELIANMEDIKARMGE